MMWKVFPNPKYVANPKYGSVHNRGAAVDITLVDSLGNELDMGTAFDHFGIEAGHAYTDLSKNVLDNRILLKNGMIKHGLNPINSEWWHYNYGKSKDYPVSNFKTECED
jgi:D-alanyl-D-alanine dipeptidase